VEQALAEAYSLGALDEPEKKLFEAHLVTCKVCRDAVRGAAVVVQAIALTGPQENPPKGSGDRLLALFNKEKGGFAGPPPSGQQGAGLWGTLALFFTLVALGTAGWGYYEHERAEKAQAALQKCHEECEGLRKILDAPDAQQLTLVPNKDAGFDAPKTKIIYSPSRGLAIIGDNLPDPATGKCYKLWSIAGGDVKPMGYFYKPGVFIDRSPGGAGTKFALSEEIDPNVEKGTRVVMLPEQS
jgi:hypothetical protein